MILGLVDEAVASGATMGRACREIGLDATTLMRWRRQGVGDDRRAGPKSTPTNKLTVEERQFVIETACSPEFRDLSPKQIVPRLADRGEYLASESTFHRFLARGGAPQTTWPAPRHRSDRSFSAGPRPQTGPVRAMELGHHVPRGGNSRHVLLPLRRDGRLEPKNRGLEGAHHRVF